MLCLESNTSLFKICKLKFSFQSSSRVFKKRELSFNNPLNEMKDTVNNFFIHDDQTKRRINIFIASCARLDILKIHKCTLYFRLTVSNIGSGANIVSRFLS